jgi:DNA-binding LacI/PurR family transcriptional regulator
MDQQAWTAWRCPRLFDGDRDFARRSESDIELRTKMGWANGDGMGGYRVSWLIQAPDMIVSGHVKPLERLLRQGRAGMSIRADKKQSAGHVTIAQVARASGVATSTASHILNERPDFSATQETRKRVHDAAAALGYRPNLAARVLRGAKTNTIGLITPTLIYEVTAAKCVAFEAMARAKGYLTMITVSPEDAAAQDRLILALKDRQVDGIALYPTKFGAHKELKALIQAGFPVVTFGAREEGLEADDVTVDYRQGGALQAGHLIELGRKKVWFVSRTENGKLFRTVELRQEGLRETLGKGGIELRGQNWPLLPDWGNATMRLYDSQMLEFLRTNHKEIDAVVASNDDIAVSVLLAARELGLHVPDDLAVVGYDDARVGRASLTSIAHDCDEVAKSGFEYLMERIAGEEGAARKKLIEAKLVVRSSTVRGS